MLLQERTPPDPRDEVGGMSEVFHHPVFIEGSEAECQRIMRGSSESRYRDEIAFPWDNYFGRSVAPWVSGDVLDLGCFTGGRAIAWWDRYQPKSIAGIDVDSHYIEAATRFAAVRGVPATFRVGIGEAIPWPDASFDTILTFDVFEHVPNLRQTMRECLRVLRPGGRLLLVFPGYFQPIEHHLATVTGTPCLQCLFHGETLIQAYREILCARGPDAAWYGRTDGLQSWERGNTINGTTSHQFARMVREQRWNVLLHSKAPIGAVGRRAQAGRGRILAAFAAPLIHIPGAREVALHRIVYVLESPTS